MAAFNPNPPLPIGTNAVNAYNDGGDNMNMEFAPPVLPMVSEVPNLVRELREERVVV